MNKLQAFLTLAGSLLLISTGVKASTNDFGLDDTGTREKCMVIDHLGNNLIKKNKADGNIKGSNAIGIDTTWIWVPKGSCQAIIEGIMKGDLDNIPQEIKDKLDLEL